MEATTNINPKTPNVTGGSIDLKSLQLSEPPISGAPTPLTLCYFTSPSGHNLYLDLYLPPSSSTTLPPVTVSHSNPTRNEIPFVIFFHGGSLLYGSRKQLLPAFLRDSLAQGFAFISVSYRLLLPCTGHDILEDLVYLVEYILSLPLTATTSTMNLINRTINDDILAIMPNCSYRLSQKTYFVSGYSAGAYLARMLCLMNETIITPNVHSRHWKLNNFQPTPPTAALLVSGQGGDWFRRQYVFPKEMAKRLGHAYDKWLYLSKDLTPQHQVKLKNRMSEVSDMDNLRFHPKKSSPPAQSFTMEEMKESNTRMGVAIAFFQLGKKLDYLTGICGLSEHILNTYFIPTTAPDKLPTLQDLIPPESRVLFPEIYLQNKEIAKEHCPVFFLHGKNDKTVTISEAKRTAEQLKGAGALVKFVPVLGWGHNWMDEVWNRYCRGEGGVMQFFREAALMREEKGKGVDVKRSREDVMEWEWS